MFYVLKPKTIKTELICFNKKVSINDNSYNIFISYKKNDHKKDFILQTPIMITPFGISEFGSNKYIDLSFINMNEDDDIRNLYNKIKEINSHILKHMRYKHKCYKRNFINSIKQSSGIYPERIRLSINSRLKIYDKYNQLIDLESIKSRILTKALIHVSHIWLNNNKFGRALRRAYPNRKVFTQKAIEIVQSLSKGEAVEIEGYKPLLSKGR